MSGCSEPSDEFIEYVRTVSFSVYCEDEGPHLGRESPGYHQEFQLALILFPKAKYYDCNCRCYCFDWYVVSLYVILNMLQHMLCVE